MSPEMKRKFDRVPVELHARFSVLVPEETFQPIEQDCVVLDLSERGVLVVVRLDSNVYSSMLQKTRFCRIAFADTTLRLPDKVTGKAVWIQPQNIGEITNYRIGLFFEDCPVSVCEKLRNFVEDSRRTI